MRVSRYIGYTIAVGAFALIAACGSSPPGSTDAADELVAGKMIDIDYDEDRVICKRQRVVGSHVPQTICKTESQIQAEREALERSVGPLRPMTGYTHKPDPGADPR